MPGNFAVVQYWTNFNSLTNMKNLNKTALMLIATAACMPSVSAKDIYVSATGNNANDGLTAATAKATLTGLNDVIEKGDLIHVIGMLDMRNEIPADMQTFSSQWGDVNTAETIGTYINMKNEKIGFNLASKGVTNWEGASFVGEDEESGFSGGGEIPLFIMRGRNKDGFRFDNITFADASPMRDGGSIYVCDEAILTFTNCRFTNIHPSWDNAYTKTESDDAVVYKFNGGDTYQFGNTEGRGGAIRLESNCIVKMNNCEFSGNIAKLGGSIMVTGTTQSKSSEDTLYINDGDGNPTQCGLYLYECKFLDNTAFGINDDADAYIEDTRGAAITVWCLNASAYVDVDHCLFQGNKTWNYAGAIYAYQNVSYGHLADITIRNSTFVDNYAERGGAIGVKREGSNPTESKKYANNIVIKLLNSTLMYNEAKNEGGAICQWGSLLASGNKYSKDLFQIVNCDIYGNTSRGDNAGFGAGIALMNAEDKLLENLNFNIYNTVIEGNTDAQGNYSDLICCELGVLDVKNSYIGVVPTRNDLGAEELGLTDEPTLHLGYDDDMSVISDYNAACYSMYDIPFIPLDDESVLFNAGNIEYTKQDLTYAGVLDDSSLQYNVNGQPVLGYDISASDQLGFPRPDGTCAIGCAETTMTNIEENYASGEDLPYLSGDTDGVTSVIGVGMSIKRLGSVIVADESMISVYTVGGSLVAKGYGNVSIANLADGVYVVSANSSNGKAVVKIVK